MEKTTITAPASGSAAKPSTGRAIQFSVAVAICAFLVAVSIPKANAAMQLENGCFYVEVAEEASGHTATHGSENCANPENALTGETSAPKAAEIQVGFLLPASQWGSDTYSGIGTSVDEMGTREAIHHTVDGSDSRSELVPGHVYSLRLYDEAFDSSRSYTVWFHLANGDTVSFDLNEFTEQPETGDRIIADAGIWSVSTGGGATQIVPPKH